VSPTQPQRSHLRVVLFSGGRGSGALTEQLVANPRIALTIAINGYDDGASTGEVRRFLGDSLGPSDFRKNAGRLARLLGTRPAELLQLLDLRVDLEGDSREAADALAAAVRQGAAARAAGPLEQVGRLAGVLPSAMRDAVADRLDRFAREVRASAAPFPFRDCAVGNVVFAGGFLLAARDFNRAIDEYCMLLALPAGLIENVTDGTNAFLVALDADGTLLRSEEEIVDAKRRNRIADIFLIDRPVSEDDRSMLVLEGTDARARFLEEHAVSVRINPRLEGAIAGADLIIYAPGTQHSSLFPSYLTPGLSGAITRNLAAIKLLVTNIQTDAEIAGSSAVDIIERATFYLKEKGRRAMPTPCLITHYLLNDPRGDAERPYVPLGRLESLEDPRLVRVANYEEGVSGRHDATKILGPFVEAFLARWHATQKVAVLFYEASTVNKVVQSILEMVRAGVRDLPIDLTVVHDAPDPLDEEFVRSLNFRVSRLEGDEAARDRALRDLLRRERFDYVILFESSGMYNGEDVKTLASYLSMGRLDAVWGSRRLSVRDIEESYRLKYRHRTALGAISYVGSHLLSLMYLALYGRYVSDTLSAARAVRVADALKVPVPLAHKQANQHLLPILLGRKAEMFEVPVQFFSISPEQVRRTTPWDGVRAIGTVVAARLRRAPRAEAPAAAPNAPAAYSAHDAAETGHPRA
jgi:2-phospho-L-lactate transferase/gluconeogenesis factor (CofD/UPF0052 family)